MNDEIRIEEGDGYCIGHFSAMASPCLIIVEDASREMVHRLTLLARQEALRVEQKFSRYRDDNIISRLHHHEGKSFEVDSETANLLDYADLCYRLSDGLFDITSGVLREIWKFNASDQLPAAKTVNAILSRIGWDKVCWQRPYFTLPAGMEIDLGGIGKEYAVDRTAQLLSQHTNDSLLINYGGDLYATRPRRNGQAWVIGLDDPSHTGQRPLGELHLKQGGMATSGDARRFLRKDGIRYGHILNPRTGWPVENAPRSITVLAPSCMEAGMLATIAMLQGSGASEFLQAQELPYWVVD
jgi:thiamine biosynthesis lipoprotein